MFPFSGHKQAIPSNDCALATLSNIEKIIQKQNKINNKAPNCKIWRFVLFRALSMSH